MLNLLDGYMQNSLPEEGGFSTNPNLRLRSAMTGISSRFTGIPSSFCWTMGRGRDCGSCKMRCMMRWEKSWLIDWTAALFI